MAVVALANGVRLLKKQETRDLGNFVLDPFEHGLLLHQDLFTNYRDLRATEILGGGDQRAITSDPKMPGAIVVQKVLRSRGPSSNLLLRITQR